LHLPVRDEISDEIMGVVDVMELLSHSAGDGEVKLSAHIYLQYYNMRNFLTS